MGPAVAETYLPTSDRVIVRPDEAVRVSKGGIAIPETAGERPRTATVVAVGPGRVTEHGNRIEPRAKKGDRVLINRGRGTDIVIGEVPHLVIREDDIWAFIG